MMEKIWNWLSGITTWLEGTWWKGFKDAVWGWFKSAAKVATFLGGIVTSIIALFDPGSTLQEIATTLQGATGRIQGLPLNDLVSKLNRLFPLQEVFWFLVTLLMLKVSVMLIRVIAWVIGMMWDFAMMLKSMFLGGSAD